MRTFDRERRSRSRYCGACRGVAARGSGRGAAAQGPCRPTRSPRRAATRRSTAASSSIDGAYRITVRDDRGFVDRSRCSRARSSTRAVCDCSRRDERDHRRVRTRASSFAAVEIDTPDEYGVAPQATCTDGYGCYAGYDWLAGVRPRTPGDVDRRGAGPAGPPGARHAGDARHRASSRHSPCAHPIDAAADRARRRSGVRAPDSTALDAQPVTAAPDRRRRLGRSSRGTATRLSARRIRSAGIGAPQSRDTAPRAGPSSSSARRIPRTARTRSRIRPRPAFGPSSVPHPTRSAPASLAPRASRSELRGVGVDRGAVETVRRRAQIARRRSSSASG